MEFSSDEPVEVTDDAELEHQVRLVNKLAEEAEATKAAHQRQRERLVELMEARGEKSLYVEVDGKVFKATVVAPERTKVDEEGLRKALGGRRFNALTTRKIDVKLLTKAVAEGKVDAGIVAEHVEIVATNPYPKVTRMEGATEE